MNQNIDRQIEFLLRLPWTIVRDVTTEGDQLLRVVEIPSAVGSGATPEEREADLWESLRESLRAYLHFNDPVPVPTTQTSWLVDSHQTRGTPFVMRVSETAATAAAWAPPKQ